MAHAGEKFGFGTGGRFRLLARNEELTVGLFKTFACLVGVLHHTHHDVLVFFKRPAALVQKAVGLLHFQFILFAVGDFEQRSDHAEGSVLFTPFYHAAPVDDPDPFVVTAMQAVFAAVDVRLSFQMAAERVADLQVVFRVDLIAPPVCIGCELFRCRPYDGCEAIVECAAVLRDVPVPVTQVSAVEDQFHIVAGVGNLGFGPLPFGDLPLQFLVNPLGLLHSG